jgi:cell division septum initiation protein DivIVA
MDWLIFGSLNIIIMTIGFLIIARRLRRQYNAQQFLSQVQQEVNTIVTELNQTTERNIQLLEDRIAAVKDTLAELDRRIVMAEAEEQKRSRTDQTYNHLREQRRVIQRTLHEPAPVIRMPEPEPETPPPPEPAPGAESVPGAEPVPAAQAGGLRIETTGPVQAGFKRTASRESIRQQVVELHRAGLDPALIAQRCGIPPGEAELIISLHGGR